MSPPCTRQSGAGGWRTLGAAAGWFPQFGSGEKLGSAEALGKLRRDARRLPGNYTVVGNSFWALGGYSEGIQRGGLGQDRGGSELEGRPVLSGRGSYSWPLGRAGEGGRQVGTRGQEGRLALTVNQKGSLGSDPVATRGQSAVGSWQGRHPHPGPWS